jgi:D-alanyl-D-alanine dipeptidase
MLLKILFLSLALLASEVKLVDVKKQDFSFVIEMANPNSSRCILRSEAAEALVRAQKVFQLTGNSLKIVECYVPDIIGKMILADRKKKGVGFDFESYFNRAGAVAVTVVDRQGREFAFPGVNFAGKKQRFSDIQEIKNAQANLRKVRTVMKQEGFEAYPQVPWFFVYQGAKDWPFLNIPFSEIP